MKVALPNFNDEIATNFIKAKEFIIFDIEIEIVQNRDIIPLKNLSIEEFLIVNNINAIICNKIDSENRTLLRIEKIELIYGVEGQINDIMIRYLSGERLGNIDENAYWSAEKEQLFL